MIRNQGRSYFAVTVPAMLALVFALNVAAQTTQIIGPAGSGMFGTTTVMLPNGNFVVTDPGFSGGTAETAGVGAVYLYSPSGTLISRMTGGYNGDRIGDVITPLSNGDFVVTSASWGAGTGMPPPDDKIPFLGAVTKCSGVTGCPATVTAENSLIGGSTNDVIGTFVTAIGNGNYVVGSPQWHPSASLSGVGASTFCNGSANSCAGKVVSAQNSLVGSTSFDLIGVGKVTVLTNGDYVTSSAVWNNGSVSDSGAVTRCSGSTGCVGPVTAANSLTGKLGDGVSGGVGGVFALPNNKFLVSSFAWSVAIDQPGGQGALTLCDNTTNDCMGQMVSPANSLIGSSTGDSIGSPPDGTNRPIWITASGDYIIAAPLWDLPGGTPLEDVGAVTRCSSTTPNCVGQTMSTANSLTGGVKLSHVGSGGVTFLTNGNFVVSSPDWRPAFNEQGLGAATLCKAGADNCTGQVVSSADSLVGSTVNDNVGHTLNGLSGITALANGDYAVSSPNWSLDFNTGIVQVGAVTRCSGTAGCTGPVTPANSLTGTHPTDYVASSGTTALTNGDYVVNSPYWFYNVNNVTDRVGAATLCTLAAPCAGQNISAANSLTGAKQGDNVGLNGSVALSNGNYVVASSSWDLSAEQKDVGAVTYCNHATNSCSGQTVTASNSLVGSAYLDQVGIGRNGFSFAAQGGVIALPNGNFLVNSIDWNNGSAEDAGAITLGNGSSGTAVGPISGANSVTGSTPFQGTQINYATSEDGSRVVIGFPGDNKVVLIGAPQAAGRTPFDYDGDGRSDISIFRANTGAWYLNESAAGFFGRVFGIATDTITPADYDGDGKTDIAVYRKDSGYWYIVNSSDGTVHYDVYGGSEDLPAPADYDGDGKADLCVFRPSIGTWFRKNSSDGSFFAFPFGAPGDKPTVGDFDGDGKADIGIFRPSNGDWYQSYSSDRSVHGAEFGFGSDVIAPADYDGDGKTDLAVYRPSLGYWFIRNSSGAFTAFPFGVATDVPAVGDFDGDGKADISVFRPGNGNWYRKNSSDGSFSAFQFGTAGDKPTQTAFTY